MQPNNEQNDKGTPESPQGRHAAHGEQSSRTAAGLQISPSQPDDLKLHREPGMWWILGFAVVCGVLVANIIYFSELSSLVKNLLLSLLFLLPSTFFCLIFFRTPVEISFSRADGILKFRYPFTPLGRAKRIFRFDELDSIQSCFWGGGPGDNPGISLILILKTGERIRLKSVTLGRPDAPELFKTLGYSEPPELAALRKEIVALTGVKDKGYVWP